jgi:hypothetical protein
MISVFVQIYNPMKINAFMSSVDEGSEMIEEIIFKKKLPVIEHTVHIPFTNLHRYYEITNKNIP